MAQNFRRFAQKITVANQAMVMLTSDSYDTVVGIHLANVADNQINVDVYITNASTNYYIQKGTPIPAGSSLSVDGKFVLQSGDALTVVTDTANSCDVWVSVVDDIST